MSVRDYIPLNFALISRWQNWALIILVVAFAGLAISLVTNQPGSPAED